MSAAIVSTRLDTSVRPIPVARPSVVSFGSTGNALPADMAAGMLPFPNVAAGGWEQFFMPR